MNRFLKFRTLSALAIAMLLPVATLAAGGTTAAPPHKAHSAWKAKHPAMVDINTASREELLALPGVTDSIADKIIAGRPFKTKAELVTKQVLTRAEYGKLRGRVIAKQAPEAKSMESAAPESKSPKTSTPESK